MALNVIGLRRVSSDLDTEGLTSFDTAGLTPYEPTTLHDIPPSPTTPSDSWGQLGLKFLQNAPTMFKQVGGGLLQAIAESEPTPPLGMSAQDPQWQDIINTHKEIVVAAREAGTLPGQKMYDEATADLRANAPNVDDSFIKQFSYDVAQGIVQMVPALTASVLAKSPALGASIIGTQVYGPKYAQSRAAGRSKGAATADALFYGLAEGIPEMIPLGILIKPGGKFLSRTLAAAGAEGIQEMVTEVFQSGYDAGILDEDMTFGEAITSIEYWQGVGYAGLVGAAVGGGLAIGSQPFRGGGQQQAPPDDAETVSTDEVRDFASKRQADLEGAPNLQPAQQQELDFLRNNETNPTAIADAYGAKLEPTGKREEAVAATLPLTQADIDSPLPTDLISEGKAVLQDAMGGQNANTILEEAGFPKINSRINVEMDAGPAIATVVDAWDQNGIRGVKLRFDDGRIKSEPFEFLTGRVTPITEEADAQKIRSDQEEVSRRRQEREVRQAERGEDLQRPAEARPEVGDQITQAQATLEQEEGRAAEPTAEVLEPEIRPIEEAPALDTKPVKQTAQIEGFVKQPGKSQAKALRELALQAGWSEVGGRLIRKTEDVDSPDYSEVVGRTKWLPRADWWPGRPGGFNEKQTAHIIEKGINGKLLGKKQREYFEFLTEIADEMIAMTAYQPSDLELTDAELEPDADSQFEVELVARAIEIDEDAVEQAAKQYEDDDAGFLRAVKAVVDQATATDEGRMGRTQAEELDLLGEDTRQAQAITDETRRRDEARNQGQESIETGKPDDLFSQARRQTDIEDIAPSAALPTSQAIDAGVADTPELRRAKKRRGVLQSLLDCVKS